MQQYLCEVSNRRRGSIVKFESLLRFFVAVLENTLKRTASSFQNNIAMLILREIKNMAGYFLINKHSYQQQWCYFSKQTFFAELQALPVVKFSFNAMPR